jgi:uncharacterized protein
MRLSRYLKIWPSSEDPDRLLLYSTTRGCAILVPRSLLAAIENGSISPTDEETLARLGFLVTDTAEERLEMLDALTDVNRRNAKFKAQLVLNLDCNLACAYCYEGGMKGRRYMSPATAILLAEFLENDPSARGKGIELIFYGGEPLMSMDLITTISERLQIHAAQRKVGYSFNLVTNGTLLTRRIVRKLIPLGLKGAKVTLDGPRENHDRFRPFVSGKGSFDTIVGNVKDVCDLIKIQVGGNYSRENFHVFPFLLDFLLDEGLTPERITHVQFVPVVRSGGDFPLPEFNEGCASVDEPWLAEASLFLREEILKRGFFTPRVGPSPCMVESDNDIVVNYDGVIFKCPALIGWQEMAVGDLETGIREFAVSHNLGVWKKDKCLDCEYLPLCFGGCRYLKLLLEGRIDDVECRKGYLDATLEAFVRQDLRHRPRKGRER